jgi:hypothetical protein
MDNKPAFIFFTYAVLRDTYCKLEKEKLTEKGFKIIGEFSCVGEFVPLGLNMGKELPSFLVLFSGKNHGHPTLEDLDRARTFAKNMVITGQISH